MLAEASATRSYSALLRADCAALPFRDGAFAGAVCVRLLHHLDSAGRRRVLAELARVSRGPVIVSYFDAATLQALRRRRRRAQRGSRRAVRRAEFLADLASAGLRAARTARPLPWVSEQTLVLAVRA